MLHGTTCAKGEVPPASTKSGDDKRPACRQEMERIDGTGNPSRDNPAGRKEEDRLVAQFTALYAE